MYPKTTHSPELARWSDSLKRLKPQRYTKRISPFTAVEKRVMILSPKKTKRSNLKAAFFQKAILNHVQEQADTPELSSSLSSFDSDSVEIDGVINRLLDDEHSINTDTDEEDYDDDIVEQALSRILATKSQTCPDIVALDRPLPPLPHQEKLSKSVELFSSSALYATKITRAAANKGQVQLKRAATWLGLPVQRLLASSQVQNLGLMMNRKCSGNALISRHNLPVLSISNSTLSTKDSVSDNNDEFTNELIYGTDSDHFAFLRSQLEKKSPEIVENKGIINKKNFVTPKRIMYCRVMQIINLASTRDCDYELHVQLNNVTLATKKGVLQKVSKNISADRPQEEALVFEIEEPFSLNFIVAARHTNTVIREGLAKMGIWPLAMSKPNQELPVAGFTCLNFENKMDVLDQGVSRFRLTKPIDKSANRWLNIELLIDIKVEEVLPAVVHRFPWSYNTHSSTSYQSIDEDVISDPKELTISQNHCKRGDFLTLYTRGMAHPTWKRYWVTMEQNQLVLHDFTYKETKEPISTIPLIPLQAVSKPSLDDCENVGIARKTGIMLQFDRNTAMLTEPVRLESDEGLEGKAYLFGDSEQKTIHWRRALSAYIADEDNKSKTTKDGVDLRFLW